MTAILPLIILAIMFFRGVHLKGFQDGLALLFVPDVRCKMNDACFLLLLLFSIRILS